MFCFKDQEGDNDSPDKASSFKSPARTRDVYSRAEDVTRMRIGRSIENDPACGNLTMIMGVAMEAWREDKYLDRKRMIYRARICVESKSILNCSARYTEDPRRPQTPKILEKLRMTSSSKPTPRAGDSGEDLRLRPERSHAASTHHSQQFPFQFSLETRSEILYASSTRTWKHPILHTSALALSSRSSGTVHWAVLIFEKHMAPDDKKKTRSTSSAIVILRRRPDFGGSSDRA